MSNDNGGEWIKGNITSGSPRTLDVKGPIISQAGPKDKYLGRIIIEFYEIDGARTEADGVAYLVDAMNGDHATLAARVAAAFAAKVSKNPKV